MKRRHLSLAPISAGILGIMSLTTTGCGKGAEPSQPANPPAVSSTSSPSPAATEDVTGTEAAAAAVVPSKLPDATSIVDDPAKAGEIVARIDDQSVTRGTLVAWMNKRPGRPALDVLDELVNFHLFSGVAATEKFVVPEGVDANDRFAVGEAWALVTFKSADPTDDDMKRWFSERRAAARLVVDDEALANRLAGEFRATPTGNPRDATRKFAEMIREHSTEKAAIAPRRVLFDINGLNETGEPAVHEAIAKAAFGLANDGEIAGPVPIGEGRFAIVQRLVARAAMDPTKVPPQIIERAREGLKARRANAAMQTRSAELRRNVRVVIEDKAFEDLRPLIQPRGAMMKGGPLDVRRVRHDRIIGRDSETRKNELLPAGAEEEMKDVRPEDKRAKTTGAP